MKTSLLTKTQRRALWVRAASQNDSGALSLQEAVQVPIWFNKYRRNICNQYPNPKTVGEALDVVINKMMEN